MVFLISPLWPTVTLCFGVITSLSVWYWITSTSTRAPAVWSIPSLAIVRNFNDVIGVSLYGFTTNCMPGVWHSLANWDGGGGKREIILVLCVHMMVIVFSCYHHDHDLGCLYSLDWTMFPQTRWRTLIVTSQKLVSISFAYNFRSPVVQSSEYGHPMIWSQWITATPYSIIVRSQW